MLGECVSKVFGEIRQLAFVVPDIDVAMEYWANSLGIGPFFIKRRITFIDFVYRGEARPSPCISIALANSGFIQIELIQQHDDADSIYKEFLSSGQHGLQHVSSWTTTAELLAKREILLAQGYEIAQECVIPASGVRLIYFSTERAGGHFIFEMADLMEPTQYERVLGIKQAHEHWDGMQSVVEVNA